MDARCFNGNLGAHFTHVRQRCPLEWLSVELLEMCGKKWTYSPKGDFEVIYAGRNFPSLLFFLPSLSSLCQPIWKADKSAFEIWGAKNHGGVNVLISASDSFCRSGPVWSTSPWISWYQVILEQKNPLLNYHRSNGSSLLHSGLCTWNMENALQLP